MMKDQTLATFLDGLASSSATPGGGGAAAVMGAMAAALVSMVCQLTIGKKNYETVEVELKAVVQQAESLRSALTDMIQADAAVFDQVMAAYRLPKDSEEQKQARTEAIQQALKTATDVPLACAKACAEVITLSRVVAEKGNKNVISDAGVAVQSAYAGLKSAALNVYVNVGAIKDESFVHTRISELNAILTGMEVSTEEIYREVESKL